MTTKAKADHREIKATNLTKEDRDYLREHGGGLSDSTLRAKWVHDPGERADRDGQTLATRSRAVIEAWAEERGGRPATVPGTEHGDRAGVLLIDFRDPSERLQEVSWDEWFRPFEERNLVFVFQQRKPEREDG